MPGVMSMRSLDGEMFAVSSERVVSLHSPFRNAEQEIVYELAVLIRGANDPAAISAVALDPKDLTFSQLSIAWDQCLNNFAR